MKSYWFMGPNPFKSQKSMPSIIWANLRRAQEHVNRALSKQEVINLIKLMKEKKLFESKQDSNGVFTNFIQQMKFYKLLSETPQPDPQQGPDKGQDKEPDKDTE